MSGNSPDESLARQKAFFAEKMAAIGEMSSGLAHEMNNVLMPVKGYAKMLKENATGPDKDKLEIIYQNANYGIEIVKNMLAFARATKEKMSSFNVVELIYSAEKLLHYQVKKKSIDLVLPPYNIDVQSTALIEKDRRVLEIGCATGFMSEYFTRKLHCTVIGVEVNPEQAALAKKKCYYTITGNVERDKTFQEIMQVAGILYLTITILLMIIPEVTART